MHSQHRHNSELLWAYYRRKHCEPQAAIPIRKQLLQENDRLAISIAHRCAATCQEPLDDLIQLARIGLIKAVERFDPNTGNAFSSFAVPYIRGEILHYLRDAEWDGGKVPRRTIELHSRVKRVQRKLAASGRELTLDEVAQKLEIPAEKWRWTIEAMSHKPNLPLSDRLAEEMPAAETDATPELSDQLYQQLGRLPDPYRRCVLERFFGQKSEEAIAARFSTTTEQVQEWISEGLLWIRHHLEAEKAYV